MKGLNSVKMSGFLMYPKLSTTASGYPKFTGRIAIPITFKRGDEEVETKIYHNISAFGPAAEGMGELIENTPIQIDGSVNTSSYNGKCKQCGGVEKKYWTEIQINNFIILTE